MCLLAALDSQGIVVKCTAAIFFLTVDCNHTVHVSDETKNSVRAKGKCCMIMKRIFKQNRRPVGSVGRVPDYCAGGRGFKPRPDHHSGSLNN